jgi:antirestriction protein ArdC
VTATDRESIDITDIDMRIDTQRQSFYMQAIRNRRFMFNPQTKTLILGRQYRRDALVESHAEEHGRIAPDEPFDDFVRGWVGTGTDYQHGVIHFAPAIVEGSPEQFDRGYLTLEAFARNGAGDTTVVRGFSGAWEQPLSEIIDMEHIEKGAHMAASTDFYEAYDYADSLIPSYRLKIEHFLSFREARADLSPLVSLPTERLEAMRKDSAAKEQEIFEGLREATRGWEEQAAQTLLLDKAIEYAQTPEATHSANRWEQTDYGHHFISNKVYQMNYHIYEETRYDKETKKSVPTSWHLSWEVSTNRPQGEYNVKIASRENLHYTDKDRMDRYIDGRKRAYAHLFEELSPPVPKEYAEAFQVNGLLLDGYTVEGDEQRQEGRDIKDKGVFEDKGAGKRQPTEQRKESTDMDNTVATTGAAAPIVLTAETTKDKLKEITDRLEAGIKGIFESGQYQTYLKTLSKFHRYSANNCMLIAMQKPDATHVAGFGSWRDNFKRNVMRGEHGIKIIAPAPYTTTREREKIDPISGRVITGKNGKPQTEEVEVTIPAFKVATVFDVSQTEGEPLPEIGVDELTGNAERYQDLLSALEKTSPVPIDFKNIEGAAKGYYSQAEKRIAIQEGMGELQTLKTAIHEIAHARLHDIDANAPKDVARPDQETREVEAESIAYTVTQRYGLDTSDYSFGYIAGWSGTRELDILKASLDTIRTEANAIITEADGHMAEIQKSRETTLDAPAEKAAAEQGDTFTIYQLSDTHETRDHRFRSLQELDAVQLTVDVKNYKETYTAPLGNNTTLENLYYTFNMDRPQDFTGHSLSVSDVVVLNKGGITTAHYVDGKGFQELPGFVAQQQAQQARAAESPLKTAEMSTEQNLNMIDGTLNNTPTVAEIEAKMKGGEAVSLADLAHAMKSEQGSERKSADAPRLSIREQLAAGREQLAREKPAQAKSPSRDAGERI